MKIKQDLYRYLSDENSIKIFNLINEERNRVYSEISSDAFDVDDSKLRAQGKVVNDELFLERFSRYEELIKPLCSICGTIAFFDDEKFGNHISTTLEKISYHHLWYGCRTDLKNLENYPLYILNNVIGVIALKNEHYKTLASNLLKPVFIEKTIRGSIEQKKILELIRLDEVLNFSESYNFDKDNSNPILVWRHVYNFIFDQVSEFIPNKLVFIEELQKYKFLLAMIHLDENLGGNTTDEIYYFMREISALEMLKDKPIWPGRREPIAKEPILNFFSRGATLGNSWGLLKAGFFQGDIKRFSDCYDIVRSHEIFS